MTDSRRPLDPEEVVPGAVQPTAPPETAPEPEVQTGHDDRGPARDERVKRLIRRHPQREEPGIDGVEPFSAPPA